MDEPNPATDAGGRALQLRPVDLDRLLHPRTVAVVGASDTPGRPTTLNWGMVRRWAERQGASVHPVNPGRDTVDGIPCVASLDDVPGPIDVAILLIADAAAGLEAATRCGAAFAIVFAAGFAEVGPEGVEAQDRLVELLAGSTTRLLGPNTNMNAFEQLRDDLEGPAIALISQSGHQGRPIFMLQENGVRILQWAPTGNEADLEFADFAAHFAANPEVGVIAAYLEGFSDGRTFALAAERCIEHDTPLVLVKVGRSETGQEAAASHTGKLSGADRVADAVMRQYGITRVDTLDQMADTATLFARAGAPRAPGVAVYSISGGTGAHVADLFAAAGLDVPRFSAERQTALHEWIPPYLQVANPIDCGGHPVGDERGRKILDEIVSNPAVGVLVVPIMGPFPPLSDRLAEDLVGVAEDGDVPIVVVWGSPVGTEPALRDVLYASSRLIVVRSVGNAVAAIGAWLAWDRFRSDHTSAFGSTFATTHPDAEGAAELLAGGGVLSEHASKGLLRRYGIPTGREVLATSEEQAIAAAGDLGGPVVLKACSAAIAHKSDLGLVAIGVGVDDVATTYHRLLDAAEAAAPGEVDGVLVCEQVGGGVELVLGISQDPTFGPTVVLGSGGVLVEVLDDVTFRAPPFDRTEAARMIDELTCRPLLDGVRGRPPADVGALVDAIMATQAMAVDLEGHLVELDINPLVVLGEGEGVVALDALAVGVQPRPDATSHDTDLPRHRPMIDPQP